MKKKVFQKWRRLFLGMILFLGCVLFLSRAESLETFLQTDWSSGASSDTATHPTHVTGWKKYQSADSNVKTNITGMTFLDTQQFSVVDTSDTDFGEGVLSGLEISGSGESATLSIEDGLSDPFAQNLGEWVALNEIPAMDWFSAYVKVGSYIYAFWERDVFGRYSIADETWDFMANAPGSTGPGCALAYPGSGDFIYAAKGGASKIFWKYSIENDTWSELASLPYYVQDGGSLAATGTLIFAAVGRSAKFVEYNIATNTWVDRADIYSGWIPGIQSQLVYPGGNYVFLARQGDSANFCAYHITKQRWDDYKPPDGPSGLSDLSYPGTGDYLYAWYRTSVGYFYRFKFQGAGSGVWQSLPRVPTYTHRGMLFHPGAGDELYLLSAGYLSGTPLKFNTTTLRWNTLDAGYKSMPFYGGDRVYDGTDYVYATNGYNTTEFQRYSISGGSWVSRAAAPFGIYYGGALAYLNGEVYATRGYAATNFAKYNPVTNVWTNLTSTHPAPATVGWGGTLVTVGNVLYAFRGNSTNHFWKYDPATGWSNVNRPTVGNVLAFSGSGLNDMTPGGTYSGATDLVRYRVSIDGTGTPNTFRWSADNGSTWVATAVPITGAAQLLNDGVTVTFASTTGHTSGNYWNFNAFLYAPDTIANGGAMVYPGEGDPGENYLYATRTSGTITFWKYDLNSGVWSDAPSLPIFVGAKTQIRYPGQGDYIYVNVDNLAYFLRYKFKGAGKGTWEILPNIPTSYGGSSGYTMFAVGDQVYFESYAEQQLSSYTISTGQWSERKMEYIRSRPYFGNVVHTGGDTVYLFSGFQSRTIWKYSLSLNKWTGTIKAPFDFTYGTKAVYPGSNGSPGSENYIYVTDGDYTPHFWKYDFINDTWEQLADAPANFYSGVQITGQGDVIYALPGIDRLYTGNTEQRNWEFLRYTISTNSWDATPEQLPASAYIRNYYQYGNRLIYIPALESVYYKVGTNSTLFYRYDIPRDTWLAETATTQSRNGSLVYTGSGNYLYYFSGGGYYQFRRYSMTDKTWADLSLPPFARGYDPVDSTLFYPGSGDFIYLNDGVHRYFARYSISRNDWDIPVTFPSSRCYENNSVMAPGIDENSIYCGGYDSFFHYDFTTRVWTSRQAPITALGLYWDEWEPQLVYPGAGNILYATRGRSRANFWAYSVSENLWSALSAPPGSVNFGSGHRLVGTPSKIYALRGDSTTVFWGYDPVSATWATLAPTLGTVNFGSSMAYVVLAGEGGFIYATRGNRTADFWRYSITNNSWEQLSNVPVLLGGGYGGTNLVYPGVGDYLYLTQGAPYDYYLGTSTVFRYSLSTDQWEETRNLNTAVFRSNSQFIFPGEGDYLYSYKGRYRWDMSKFLLFKKGTYTSDVKIIGRNQGFDDVVWNGNVNDSVFEVRARTANSYDMTGAVEWDDVPVRKNDDDLTSSYPAVVDRDKYLQYRIRFFADDLDPLPAIEDITLNYQKFPPFEELISSPYNSTQANNRVMNFAWGETTPSGSDLRFQLRTAPDSGGVPGAWTPWIGPAGTQTFDYAYDNESDYVYPPSVEITDGTARLKKIHESFDYTQRLILDNRLGTANYTDAVTTIEIGPENKYFWEHVQSDGRDVRFADSAGSSLPHNLHANGGFFDFANRQARIFVKVSELLANEKTVIYLKYGNPAAVSTSDGDVYGVPSNGLVAYWNFNEGSGSALTDLSGNNNTGTLVNSPAWVDGVRGQALSFNGSSQYVDVGNIGLNSLPLTFSLWIKLPTNIDGTWRHLVSNTGWGGNPGYATMINSNQQLIMTLNGGESTTPRPNFNMATNTWQHVAYVMTATSSKIYINGVLRQTWAVAPALSTSLSSTFLGWNPGGNYARFWGAMDEVALYNRVLSDEEIQQIASGSTGFEVPYYFSSMEGAEASPSLSGWDYRLEVEIDNSLGPRIEDFTAKVELDSSHEGLWNRCRADGFDVRFVDSDNTTILNHHRDTFDYANESAIFYVRVPLIEEGETRTLYLYYGRADAADTSEVNSVHTKDFAERGDNISAIRLDGSPETRLEIPSSASLNTTDQVTLETQFNLDLDYWPDGWTKRKTVTINNSGGSGHDSALVDIDVVYAAGMKNDFTDLRFWDTSHERKLRYLFVDTNPGVSATVRVEVFDLPANNSLNIFMYYGNSEAAQETQTETWNSLISFGAGGVIDAANFDHAATLSLITGNTTVQFQGTTNDWGTKYLTYKPLSGRFGETTFYFQFYQVATTNHDFIGWKLDNATHSYTQMPYAFYFNNGVLQIYEMGVNVQTVGAFTRNIWYDGKIVLKPEGGAKYYWRVTGLPDWILVRDSDVFNYENLRPSMDHNRAAELSYTRNWAIGQNRDVYAPSGANALTLAAEFPVTFSSEQTEPDSLKWLPGFQYRKELILDNSGGFFDANALARFTVPFVAGKMNADYSDLRFVDHDGTLLNYQIESFDQSEAVIRLMIPGMSANSFKNIYVYYGNSMASPAETAEDFTNIFDYPDYTGWMDNSQAPPYSTTYSGVGMMGGYNRYGIGAWAEYTIQNLPAGTFPVTFTYYVLDSWDNEYGRLYANGVLVWDVHRDSLRQTSLGNITANGTTDYKWTGTVNVVHAGGGLTLRWTSSLDQGSTDESWGLDEVEIPVGEFLSDIGAEETQPVVEYGVISKAGSYALKLTEQGLSGFINDDSVVSTLEYLTEELAHYAFTYDGEQAILYVNGELKNQEDYQAEITVSSAPVVIGQGLKGVVDESRIWNVSRKIGSINEHAHRYLFGTEDALVMYLPLNENAGIIASDLTSNNNDAVFHGGVTWTPSVFQYSKSLPRGAWNMDDGGGSSSADASGNGNTLTLSGAQWVQQDLTDFSNGAALNFRGITDYAYAAHADILNLTDAISLEAWIRPTDIASTRTIILKGITGNNRENYKLIQSGDNIVFRFYNLGYRAHSPGSGFMSGGQTYHIVATYDRSAGQVKIYSNGQEIYSGQETLAMLPNSDQLIIGRDYNVSSPFYGLIDGVRIYNRVLAPEEVLWHYERRSYYVSAPLNLNIHEPPVSSEIAAFATDNPVIQPVFGVFYSNKNIAEFTDVMTAPLNTDIRYQISQDGYTWFWYDGVAWNPVTAGYAQTNTAAEIDAELESYFNLYPDGDLYYRAFLHVDGGTFSTPILDNVAISLKTGDTYYTNAAGAAQINSLHSDAANDQWVQYKAIFYSDGEDTPELKDVTATYVTAYIQVLTPNGGEELDVSESEAVDPAGLTKYNITWQSQAITGDSGGRVKLEYSKDNGATWTLIENNVADTGTYSWRVPDAGSHYCLVKVSSVDFPVVSDVSDAVFSILAVELTKPNGGEIVEQGRSYGITWINKGTIPGNVVKLEYSLNNGSTWTQIANNQPNTNSYNLWVVPSGINNESDSAIVRLSSSNNPDISDVSDAVFSIVPSPAITVTAPTGGQSWSIGTQQTISWRTTSLQFADEVVIQYSTDDFVDDVHLIAQVSTGTPSGANSNADILGSYAWTIPSDTSVSDNFRIRVREASVPAGRQTQQAVAGLSGVISMREPSITLTSPGSASVWVAGDTNLITWSSVGAVSNNLLLEYLVGVDPEAETGWVTINALDGGNNPIGEANDGTFSWVVPLEAEGESVFVRITDRDRPQVTSVSESFQVLGYPKIMVTSPNGGEEYIVGTSQTITWQSYGRKLEAGGADYNKINISYSVDNGGTWTVVAFNVPNTKSYNWASVPDAESDQALIKIEDGNDALITDVSDENFSIVAPVITVTAPNGGETFYATGQMEVQWTGLGAISNNLTLQYSTDSGSSWTNIATGVSNSGSYQWTSVADVTTNTALIRVIDAARVGLPVEDDSNGVFSIISPSITVTSPNGAEELPIGTYHAITWTTLGHGAGAVRDRLTIQYSSNGGSTWSTIATDIGTTNEEGIFNWQVPDSLTTQARIKIFDATRPATVDSSDANFSIVLPYVRLSSPTQGLQWPAGTVKTITWTSVGAVSEDLSLMYSTDNGSTWKNFVPSAEHIANTLSYVWTVPDDVSSTVKIRLLDNLRPAITDISPTFLIVNPIIKVTAPNGGELWTVGQSRNITWENIGSVGANLRFEYSKDNFAGHIQSIIPTSVTNNGANATDNSAAWTIPDDVSTTVRVRITDNDRTVVNDKSDASFTILPVPVITVTAPQNGDLWRVGDQRTITWVDNGGIVSNNLTLSYSVDDGGTWTTIATGVPNTKSYVWTVADNVAEDCKIRIEDPNWTPTTTAVSDGTFTIAHPLITISYPAAGQKFAVGDNLPVVWTTEGSVSNNLVMQYSADGGATYFPALNSQGAPGVSEANDGAFTWKVPDTLTSNALFRIIDANRPATVGVTAGSFHIIAIPRFVNIDIGPDIVTKEFVLGEEVEIIWVSEGLSISNNLIIDASTDNFVTTVSVIATGVPNTGSYLWEIPQDALTGPTLKVRITDGNRTEVTGRYGGFFRIRGGFKLTSPNGGQNWVAKATHSISWETQGNIPRVKLEYTTNDGTSWSSIAASLVNSGSYSWVLPDIKAPAVKVRISDPDDSTVNDASDNAFAIVYVTVKFNVLDFDTLQHLADFSISEPSTGWTDSGVNSPLTRELTYPYGTYTTFFVKTNFIDSSVSWIAPKEGTDVYVINAYMENAASAQVSWDAILTYSYSPGDDTLNAVGSLQRKGKLVGVTEVERSRMGGATFKIYEPDGQTVRKSLTATTPNNTGMFTFTYAGTDFESGKVYPATLSVVYNEQTYTSTANIDVGSEILQYEFFTQTATELAASVAKIEEAVAGGTEQTRRDIQASQAALESHVSNVLATTETTITEKVQDVKQITELAMKSEILNKENSVKSGSTLVIRYRTYPNVSPTIDVYDAANTQRIVKGSMTSASTAGIYEYSVRFQTGWGKGNFTIVCSDTTNGSLDALAIEVVTADIESISGQVAAVLGTTSSLNKFKEISEAMESQFGLIEAAIASIGQNLATQTASLSGAIAGFGESGTIGGGEGASGSGVFDSIFNQLSSVAKNMKEFTSANEVNLDKLYDVSEEKKGDIIYLKNKTQELKALMELNNKMVDDITNAPVTQTWYEYR